jgi:hypothetical protein
MFVLLLIALRRIQRDGEKSLALTAQISQKRILISLAHLLLLVPIAEQDRERERAEKRDKNSRNDRY